MKYPNIFSINLCLKKSKIFVFSIRLCYFCNKLNYYDYDYQYWILWEEKSRGLVDEANENLAKSKKEAFEIVEKAKVDANKEKEQIIEEAKLEAKEEKQKAREEIAQEIEANKEQIRKEIVDVALTASSELLGREVNDKDNKRLLDDFVNDLEKGDK